MERATVRKMLAARLKKHKIKQTKNTKEHKSNETKNIKKHNNKPGIAQWKEQQ